MKTDAHSLWSTRIVTFAICALAAASTAYWSLKAWGPHEPSTAPVVSLAQATPVSSLAVARALGGTPATALATSIAPPAISRYALVGVVAGRSRAGAALVSVDGQEARPVRVGTLVDDRVMLQSVEGRRAVFSFTTGTAEKFTLELPSLEE
jgi:general secretion pathway protein C